jgi:hypothetical protein
MEARHPDRLQYFSTSITMNIKLTTSLILFVFLFAGCVGLSDNVQTNQIFPTGTATPISPGEPVITLTPHVWATQTYSPEYIEWMYKSQEWLKGVSCSAPCWNDIIPGITTVREAVDLLKKSSMIDPETIQIVRTLCRFEGEDELLNSRRIIWNWSIESHYTEVSEAYFSQQDSPKTHVCGVDFARIDTISPDNAVNNGIVTQIKLHFPGPNIVNSNDLLMPTLGKVIEAYGEPSHIVAIYVPVINWYTLNVIYEKQGFTLLKAVREEFDLNEAVTFQELIFSSQPIQAGLRGYETDVLNIWQGMKSFDFYCRFENGEPCK